MKSEAEIRTKLDIYKRMLAGFWAGRNIDKPSVFLTVEHSLPGEGLAGLHSTVEMDKAIAKMSLEDQQGIKGVFEDYVQHTQRFLEDRISILKWVLDEEG